MPCMDHGRGDQERADRLAAMLCRTCALLYGEPIWDCVPADIREWYGKHLEADEKAGRLPSWWGK